MAKIKYKEWTLIPWDGNTELGYMCYRKSFRNGHVSVGVGDFHIVSYSYGPNHEDSYGSTRDRRHSKAGRLLTEQEAMDAVDRGCGYRMVIKP